MSSEVPRTAETKSSVRLPGVTSALDPLALGGGSDSVGGLMQIEKSLFTPAARTGTAQKLSRPSLSYWQDAWIRLKKNKQAIVSLWMVIALVLFSFVGPFIWTVDSSVQELGRISEPPSLNKTAVVIDELALYEEVVAPNVPETPTDTAIVGAELPAPSGLRLMAEATNQSVRLQWDPVPGASGYVIYRGDSKPQGPGLFGVPLTEVFGGNKVSYEDIFDLKTGKYFYTVVAKNGDESTNFATLEVEARSAIKLADAQLLQPEAQVGQTVSLGARPMGTDALGRDLLARLMAGGRISLFIGFVAPFFSILIGVIIGGISGYAGGRVDHWIMRFTDFVLALPFLLFMILFRVVSGTQAGESGIAPMLLAMIVLSWTGAARLTRGQVLQLRESEFVQAARLLGARPYYLILRHLLPNTLGVILISLTFAIPSAIFTEAFLSFIGMGVVPPTPSWGSMCDDGVKTFLSHPHEFLFPALFISLTVLAFNLLGDGLRDALDPRLRSTE
jgi:oligopeptide transport system permease protein